MRTAFVVLDRMTALDFVGIYDPLIRKQMDYPYTLASRDRT